MKYIQADINDIEEIFNIVQESIKETYPKYYPKEVVDFFCDFHCRENILKDINDGLIGKLMVDGVCVGTGCYRENHITRVYVTPKNQGKGYGTYIMDRLEAIIAEKYTKAYLDASLPASHMYEKRGYFTREHCKYPVANDVILVYEVMEKKLVKGTSGINYDGRRFIALTNTDNGEVDADTVFNYHQNGDDFSADYSGGDIKTGYMVGKVRDGGELDFYYEHLNTSDEIRIGKCHSIPTIKDNGKLELHEKWQWINGDCTAGESVVTEL